jgi:hypothetical protein
MLRMCLKLAVVSCLVSCTASSTYDWTEEAEGASDASPGGGGEAGSATDPTPPAPTASGGSGTPAGTGGTAGADTPPAPGPRKKYATNTEALLPAAANRQDVINAYAAFKASYFKPVSDGTIRIDCLSPNSCSEGQGYGMIMAAWLNDDATEFDKVWNYTKKYLNDWGLMAWNVRPDGTVEDWNAATDADVDIAIALDYAGRKFGRSDLTTAAREMAKAIYDVEVSVHGFNAGNWQNKDPDTYDTHYQAPGYCQRFAAVSGIADYTSVPSRVYSLYSKAYQNYAYLPWHLNRDGWLAAESDDSYGVGGSRAIWRIAVDYLWNGNPEAKKWLIKTYERHRADAGTALASVNRTTWEYTATTGKSTWKGPSPVVIGAYGLAAMAAGDAEVVDECYRFVVQESVKPQIYFFMALETLYLAALSGDFTRDP